MDRWSHSNLSHKSSGIRHVQVNMPPIVDIYPPAPSKKIKKGALTGVAPVTA